jgi:hypothetical protein
MCRPEVARLAFAPPRPHLPLLDRGLRQVVAWLGGIVEDLAAVEAADAGVHLALNPEFAAELRVFQQLHYDADANTHLVAVELYHLLQAYQGLLAALGAPVGSSRDFARRWLLSEPAAPLDAFVYADGSWAPF